MNTIPFSRCGSEGLALPLACVNWPEFSFRPSVSVRFRHDGRALFVRFDVVERHVRALETEDNRPVCPDSCVECFILCGDGRNYINLECNPLGTLLAAKRSERPNKTPLTVEELAAIGCRGNFVGHEPFEHKGERGERWWLEIEVPFAVIGFDSAPERIKLNAYKCGDMTETKHYLSLFPIDTERPDFHRPEFFGDFCLAAPENIKEY